MTDAHEPIGANPVFLLSFRQRDALAGIAERAGWSAVSAQRTDNAERRFILSGADIAVVDARGAFDEGLAAVRRLADPVEANAGALVALVSRKDAAALDRVFAAGATHFLASPFGEEEFAQTLRFADRHARRLAGEFRDRVVERHNVPRAALARPEEAERSSGARSLDRRDSLTGLGDVHGARRWIKQRLATAGGEPRLALILVAISRFDTVNAAFGQETGDDVLRGVARRMERSLGSNGGDRLIARLAGAEFLIGLTAPTSLDQAAFVADQIVAATGAAFVSGDHVVRLGVRCGVVADRPDDSEPAALLRRASAALAEAREAGEARPVRVMDAEGEDEAARANQLEIDLRVALQQDEIEVLFQPQVSVTSGAIIGVEALARWRHPVYGALDAATLFAAAERSDHLLELSEHVQRKAAGEAARWPAALAELRVAINVTAADFARPDFVARFIAIVDEAGLARGRVTVEVTEGGLIADLGGAAAMLAGLRAQGFRVAIDDFGTGYSSLAYLKSLPLDYLKIDKGLSDDITGSTRDRIVVHGVIEMARSLGLTVVAEGVESEAQLALLAEEGCTIYQGYLCAPPVGVEELVALVAR